MNRNDLIEKIRSYIPSNRDILTRIFKEFKEIEDIKLIDFLNALKEFPDLLEEFKDNLLMKEIGDMIPKTTLKIEEDNYIQKHTLILEFIKSNPYNDFGKFGYSKDELKSSIDMKEELFEIMWTQRRFDRDPLSNHVLIRQLGKGKNKKYYHITNNNLIKE